MITNINDIFDDLLIMIYLNIYCYFHDLSAKMNLKMAAVYNYSVGIKFCQIYNSRKVTVL